MTPASLNIFASRLDAVCGEMGLVLRNAAFSPNIRDRLDFSCAVFDVDGSLCAQAAHIPVHLGSMAFAMRGIVSRITWSPGDQVILNDPFLGGTHLPDVTVIAPVFHDETLCAFVVNRAHHADIGAASPGSMPISTRLDDEGVVIEPVHLVRGNELLPQVLQRLTRATRNRAESEGDFAAQLAANRAGASRLGELVASYGVAEFSQGIVALNDYAERLARAALADIPSGRYVFSDCLDDDGQGNRDIAIEVALTVSDQGVVADFSGTAAQVPGNVNCPLAVAAAAVYYVFRCLMPPQTPACAGAFRPIVLYVPEGCLLNARKPAAVAAGNVETSTRVVDVILGALAQAIPLRIPAASHGSMNNLAVGSAGPKGAWDYYETIGGGMGAGAYGGGLDGLQTHMTNTLNTPVEVLESRFPLRVSCYRLRRGSGGDGARRGGDGLVREFQFLAPAHFTLLTERRSHAPWGVAGGGDGQPGVNSLNGRDLPSKCEGELDAGDRLRIETPGGAVGDSGRLEASEMCGICGELRLDGTPVAAGLIESMLPALQRRGPDDAGIWQSGSVALGHRRLSIIDLSSRSHQPMVDAELSLVFNGAIYNYRELRADLQARGHVFASGGDTEVILKAYREWGVDCPAHLHGMFAFAIWDGRRQSLFAARDRFGIKPFYYALDDSRFRFASNTQALLDGGGIDTAIDPVGLHFQYTLHAVIPAPHTILRGIRKLEPAHSLQLDANGRQTQRRYWDLDATRPAQPRSEQEWVDATHEALLDAVRKRNDVADVPVGVLLSGGLDSSLLVALLAEIGVRDFHTFSVGFEDQPEEKGSEFEFSDQVVERYRPIHHKFLVPNDQVLERLPEAVDAMAEPMFGQDAVAFYLLSEKVSKSIKVVQSGQGADEVFGGYFWYPRMAAEREGSRLERFRQHYFDRDHPEFLRMVTPPYRGADHTGEFIARRLDDALSDDFLDAVLKLDVTTLIVDDPVKRVDNMTMAWGLEARVPFLDHHLVEVAARCPAGLKLQSDGKHLLKRIARGIVPDAVIDRPKGYFPMPALKYVRGPFLEFMRGILDSQACRERRLFDRSYVDSLLAAPEMHHTRIMGSKLWHLALLEFWLQRNVDGRA